MAQHSNSRCLFVFVLPKTCFNVFFFGLGSFAASFQSFGIHLEPFNQLHLKTLEVKRLPLFHFFAFQYAFVSAFSDVLSSVYLLIITPLLRSPFCFFLFNFYFIFGS